MTELASLEDVRRVLVGRSPQAEVVALRPGLASGVTPTDQEDHRKTNICDSLASWGDLVLKGR
jgi:hypothetical protein